MKISELEQQSIFEKKILQNKPVGKKRGLTPHCLPFMQLCLSIKHKPGKIFYLQDIYIYLTQGKVEKGSKMKKNYKLDSAF